MSLPKSEAFYHVLDETGTDPSAQAGEASFVGSYWPTSHTAGPWSGDLQHVGPPSALLARAIGRLGGGPASAHLARVAIEILAPVPVASLRIEASSLRSGRKVNLCDAALFVDGSPEPVMRMRAWKLRELAEPISVPPTAVEAAPGEGRGIEIPPGWLRGYLDAVEWRWVDGSFEAPGPATVWTRLLVDLVAGETPTPTERVLAVADSASGISAVANPIELLFLNTDLTVHFARPPVGESIWMRAQTRLDGRGFGLATSVLGDVDGGLAVGAQALFVDSR